MTQVFTYEIRVRYAECDAQGCVFNGHYLMYFDVAMTELWREAVGSYGGMIEAGTDMVVAEARVRYRSPVLFDELVSLEARVTRLGTTSMTTALNVVRNADVAAEGELRHVFVRAGSSEVVEIPAEIRTALEPYVDTGAPA